MQSTKQKPLQGGALLAAISEETSYLQYESDDILNGFIAVLQDTLLSGKTLKLRGLGTFSLKENKPRNFISKGNPMMLSKGSYSVAFKMDDFMRTLLKEKYKEVHQKIKAEDAKV